MNDTPVAVNDYNIAKESIAGSGNYTNTDTTGYKATGNVLSNDTDKDAYSETKTVTGIFSTALGSTPAAASTNTYITLTSAPSSNSITGSIVYYLDNSSNKVFLKDSSNNNLSVSIYDSSTLQVKLSGIVSTSIPSGATLHFTNNTNSNNDIATSVYGSSTTQQPSASVVLDNAGTVYVGMSVQGTGIPAGTVVGSVNTSTNTITLKDSSNNAVAVLLGSNTSLSFTAAAGTTITGRYGTLTIAANGGYTYTPTANNANLNEGQQGTETFSYRMQDSAGSTADATLTIRVLGSGTNDPHAVADVNTIVENSINVTGNVVTGTGSPLAGTDTTPSNTDTLSVTTARSSSSSSETLVGTGTQITGLYGTLTISSTGAYTYALNNSNAAVDALRLSSDTLTDVFFYRVTNSSAQRDDVTTLTITITGANDAPVAVADTAIARESGGYANGTAGVNPSGNVLTNDTDVDAGDTKAVNAIQAGGSLTGSASTVTTGTTSANGTAVAGSYGSLTVGADGSYVYTVDNSNATVQALAFGQTLTDSFTYRVVDANGATSTAMLTVTIQGANDAPTNAVPSNGVTVAESSSVALSGISVADVDDASLTVQLTVQNGTLTVGNLNGALVSSGTNGGATLTLTGTKAQLNSALGTLSYQGAADYSGIDLLTVQTTDSAGLVALSTVDVTVTADSRALVVTGSTVNETSPYLLFKVDGTTGQKVTLALQSTGTGSGDATIGADLSPNLEYFNGTAWTAYTGGAVTIPTGDVLLVRTAVYGDSLYEGGETVKLVASNKAGANYNGTGTIIDDGTGAIYLSTNTSFTADTTGIAQYPDDDRPLTVNSISVNEASPYAVFTVSGNANQVVRLSLTDGTATSPADYGTGLQYYNGTAWVAYTPGSDLTMTGSTLLVRTSIVNDSTYEGQEAFLLGVTKLGSGTTVYGTASIYDDGTGSVYLATNTTGTANVGTDTGYPSALDDDRSVSVSSPTVNEGSDYAIFTLTGNSGQTVSLTLENVSASINTSQTLKVWDGLDWVDYTTTGALPTFDANGKILVRVDIRAEQDAVYEGAETFKLKATLTGQTAAAEGIATIKDDGTGSVYLSTNTTGTANTSTDTGYPSYLDDDRAVTVNSITVNEASPYAVFTVSGSTNQVVRLSLTDGTATSTADYGTGLEYYNGTAWVTYTAGSDVTMTGSTLLVRTSIVNDSTSEGSETFKLVVTRASSSTTAEGTATIRDDAAGDVYLATNTTGTANVSTDTGYPSYLDDDRAVTVNSISVNEASPYAVFTVSGSANQVVRLSLTDGTATSTADFGTGLEYYTGTTWATYTPGSDVTMTGSTLLVRTSIVNDSTSEGSETFKLVVTRASSGTTAEGTATIKDDGTGSVYLSTNTTGTANTGTDTGYPSYLDDDRAVTVSSISVNEASPYAVFTVSGSANQVVRLSLTDGTATSTADFGTGLEYYNGTAWVTYTAGSDVTMTGSTLLVRTSIVNDSTYEGSETFKLVVTRASSGTTAEGTATIRDDAAGDVYLATNTTGIANTGTDTGYPAQLDDDRAVTVSSISVNEASPYAVFTVSGSANQVVRLSLTDGTATSTADFGTGLEYYTGTAWVTYTPGSDVTMTGSTLLVRTSIVNDSTSEGSETFKLVVTRASSSTTAEGTATIRDDAAGDVYLATNTTGTANVSTDTGYPSYLDDDRAVTVNSISVNEASPYAVFTVSGSANQVVRLSLTDGTATSTADFGTGLEYYTGTTWATYTPGSDVTMTGSTLLVRTSIVNDSTSEGSETFKLVVTRASSGTTAEGTATIKDDGTGSVYLSTNTTGTANTGTDTGYPSYLDDDRAVTVSSISVNEASPYAVFTVSGSANQVVRLSLTDGTATSTADFGTGLEYYNGTAWVTYTAGSDVTMTGSTLLVRTSIVNDSTYEGSETFKLVVTRASSGTTAEGTATIRDDAAGDVYLATNTTGTVNLNTDTGYPTQLDDDRPTIAHVGNGTVNSITVTEGQSAVFSVALSNASSATETFVLGLAGVTATSGTDFRTAPTFSNGVTYDATAGTISVPAGVTRFTVTIPTVDDGDVEASETFTLTIGAITGTATITDNDVAPTPPTVVVTPPVTPTVPEPPTTPVTPVIPTDPEVVTTPVTPTVPEVVPTPVTPTVPEVVSTPATPAVPQITPPPVVVTEVPATATPVVQSTPASTPAALSPVVTPQPSAGFAPLVEPAIVPAEIGSTNALPSRPDDAVRQNPQYELRVDKPIPDVLIPTGTGSIAYILPVDAFKHTDPNARVEMSASLIDGKPLPSWLKFDPVKGAFTGTPPQGYRGDLQVKVVARDGVGRQAETMVHLKVGDVPQRQTQLIGKPGLAQQLKGHGLHAWKADRERLIHQAREAASANWMSKSGGRLA
ncbi:VCBS domain-containing protein [Azospirillum oryzae]|uniref:VCBS domain-containing protein n=1 Tax=Azospirillum oryzae TaxID=286727 RepID=UPI00117819AD|nr:VCBS domain-containing protein [Azospirillum oryzae]